MTVERLEGVYSVESVHVDNGGVDAELVAVVE
jgi:hypothetical protein